MKIWLKNFLYTAGIISIVSFVTLLMFYHMMPKYYEYKIKNQAIINIEKMIAQLENQSIENIIKIIASNIEYNYTFKLQDEKGNSLILPNPFINNYSELNFDSDSYELPNLEKVNEHSKKILDFNLKEKTFQDNKQQKYTLSTKIYLESISDAKEVLLDLAPYVVSVSFLLGLISAFFYSKLSTKRIRQLSETTKKMIDLNHNTDCIIHGNDEITYLANDINYLNTTLKKTIRTLQTEITKVAAMEKNKAIFVQSVAHELKTPISVMYGLIEGMSMNIGKYKDRNTYLEKCQQLLTQQTELISEITELYKSTEATEKGVNLENIQITDLVAEVLLPFQLISSLDNKIFNITLEPTVIFSNKKDVQRLLSNIISNAYRYAFKNSCITITFHSRQLVVENRCKPLSPHDLENIFEPFYRPDFARTRQDGGTGLGLFFIKKIAEHHHYTYTFKPNKNNNGMLFILNL